MKHHLLDQAIELALTGMGTVFVFLILLICFTLLMSRLTIYFDKSIRINDEELTFLNKKKEIAKTVALHHHHHK